MQKMWSLFGERMAGRWRRLEAAERASRQARWVITAAAAVPLAIALAGCSAQYDEQALHKNAGSAQPSNASDRATANVAVLLDLSGGQSTLGRAAMSGFLLALEESSLGDQPPTIFVRPIDTRTETQRARVAAESLAALVSAGAGFTDNESLLAAGPAFQREGVPFLSIGATDPALPQVVGDSVFLACFGDNTQAAAGAEFAHKTFGETAAVLWDSTSEYTTMLPQYFRAGFEHLGGSVALDVSFDGGCDLAELAARITALQTAPSFVYLAAMPDCAGELVASLRAAGISQPILGGDGLDTPNLLEGGDKPTTDVWFTTHAWLSPETGTQRAKAFIESYERVYGHPPQDAFAALGYDAAHLMVEAVHRAGSSEPARIRDALMLTRDFQGVTGEIGYEEGRQVPMKTVWIVEVRGGKRSLAEALVPQFVPEPIVKEQRQ